MGKRRNQNDPNNVEEVFEESTPSKRQKIQQSETDDLADSETLVNFTEVKKRGRPRKKPTVDESIAKPNDKQTVKAKKTAKVRKQPIDEEDDIDQKAIVEECDENSDDENPQNDQNKSATLKKFDFQEFSGTPAKRSNLSESSSAESEREEQVEPEEEEEVESIEVELETPVEEQSEAEEAEEKVVDKSTAEELPIEKKKRGRPSKKSSEDKSAVIVEQPAEKKKGRPKKVTKEEQEKTKKEKPVQEEEVLKSPKPSKETSRKASTAKKGRPAKESAAKEKSEEPATEKKKRGRKPKQADSSNETKLATKAKTTKKQKVKPTIVEEEELVEKSEESSADQPEEEVAQEVTTSHQATSNQATEMSKKKEKNLLKVISFNVNGVRACIDKGLIEFLTKEDADIVCLQELKCKETKMPKPLTDMVDYHFYSNSPNDKDGYSGVATLSKIEPIEVIYDLGNPDYDGEGRSITCEYEKFFLINVYATNAGRGLPRLGQKRNWNEAFRKHLMQLDKKKPVIACGDFNCAHTEIDLENPKTNVKTAGFTPEEREDFTLLLDSGFFDSYRHLNPDQLKAYTFWSYMSNARAKDIGWRLDYFILSDRLKKYLVDNVINNDVLGSDHCPITLTIRL